MPQGRVAPSEARAIPTPYAPRLFVFGQMGSRPGERCRGFFFLPLKRDLALSSAAVSLLYGAARLEGGVEGPLVGYLIDRFGPRVVIIGGAAILFFFLSQGTWQHYVDITPTGSRGKVAIETGAARWELLKFTMTQLKENPFQMIGYGRGSFVKKYREFSDQYKGALLWHAHNTFLNVALQTGIQGLVIFLLLVYKILAFSYRQGKCAGTPEVRYFLLATFFMVIVYFVR